MTATLRFLQLFALGTWIGGIIFLSFVEAPGVFRIVASGEQAGSIVGYSLTRLHYIGMMAALIYLIAGLGLTMSLKWLASSRAIPVGLMLGLTLVSEYGVRPRMADLRAQMDAAHPAPSATSVRAKFDRLHRESVQLEGATLFLGLAAFFLTAQK